MKKSILVVDDEAAVTFSLEGFFQQKGYEVLKAFYGDQALEQLQRNRPSLVILDLQMPRVNGIAVLEKIRSDYPDTKTLVITGFSEQYEEELKRLKPERVWTKPVSLTELTDAVESLLEGTGPSARSSKGPAAARGSERVRILFVEGSQEAYERSLKPYFESPERSLSCETSLAKDPDAAIRLVGEIKPQLIVLDSSRMPVGVDGGRLAARLAGTADAPMEIILIEIPSRDFQDEVMLLARLGPLEGAIQKAVRKHRL